MTTINEDAPDQPSGAQEPASPESRPRVRRFAPRRSRSANANLDPAHAVGSIQPATAGTEASPASVAPPGADIEARSQPLVEEHAAQAPAPAPNTAASAEDVAATQEERATPKPARRSRSRRVAASASEQSPPPPTAAVTTEPAAQLNAADAEAPAAAAAGEQAEQPAKPSRTRARPRQSRGAAAEAPTPVVEAATVAPMEPAPETPIEPEPPQEPAPSRPVRARRSRKQQEAGTGSVDAATEAIGPSASDTTPGPQPADSAAVEEYPAIQGEPGLPESGTPAAQYDPFGAVQVQGGLLKERPAPFEQIVERPPLAPEDGEDLLTQALRELFPLPSTAEDRQEPTEPRLFDDDEQLAADVPLADEAIEDLDDTGEDAALLGEPGEIAESEEATVIPRRGRRGRRGGRGRRRNGTPLTPPNGEVSPAIGDDYTTDNTFSPITATPAASAEPATSLFVPESPARRDRPWRERGPRRQWGRTFSREEQIVRMPPPKPSNGLRPGPIPQAAPPLAAVAEQPEILIPPMPTFTMPDLRIDEPLAPGETRTERLLEAQTRLLQAMFEQQSRQIDALTTTVNSLRQTVQHLSGNSMRTYQPRTGIFVDAPNVCYAAENARVNLDFGRMLKYLSKDRHLVHAFSYAPITDDVREGIRYETQRFVAPFLRTGYKLVTKPLKRFPDGSAKGNFDIELAIDIVTMSERLDVVVLVSGDSDFERLIELIQSKGVRVEVVAFASNVSTELVNIADVFIDINQHLEHMRAL